MYESLTQKGITSCYREIDVAVKEGDYKTALRVHNILYQQYFIRWLRLVKIRNSPCLRKTEEDLDPRITELSRMLEGLLSWGMRLIDLKYIKNIQGG